MCVCVCALFAAEDAKHPILNKLSLPGWCSIPCSIQRAGDVRNVAEGLLARVEIQAQALSAVRLKVPTVCRVASAVRVHMEYWVFVPQTPNIPKPEALATAQVSTPRAPVSMSRALTMTADGQR